MARTISDEELQLRRRARRRLIGAVVLVTAVVVILPMVLDSEPRPSGQPISVQIPSPDSGGFAPKLAPAPAVPQPKASAVSPQPAKPAEEPAKIAAAAPPVQEAPSPVAAAPKQEPEPPAKPEPPTKPKPKPKAPPAKAKGGYVVQVIALADAGKAQQLQQQIAGAGIKSYTEVVKTAKGDVTRVRAGPFASRGAAEKARDQLKGMGMNGNITPK
jgi:DedD protein